MSENSGWIKMSERRPTVVDLPIIVTYYNGSKWFRGMYEDGHVLSPIGPSWQFWKTFGPSPELCEQTRDEQDKIACEHIYSKQGALCVTSFRRGFFAALEDERSAIRALIHEYRCNNIPAPELIRQLQERVKL
jgi:hypothetical protein